MSVFQPLEVVDRDSETQPQVVEKWNKLTQQVKGYNIEDKKVFFQFCVVVFELHPLHRRILIDAAEGN